MPTLGIDVGTQSLKAVLLGDRLQVLGMAQRAYQATFPRPGWAEQSPQLWLDALGPAIGGALAAAGLGPADISALAICGQLDGCVPSDANGAALAPAIIWMDRRAAAEVAHVDGEFVRTRAGLALDATHMAAKIAWFAQHSPGKVATWHQPVTYFVAALTGRNVISHSLASTTTLSASRFPTGIRKPSIGTRLMRGWLSQGADQLASPLNIPLHDSA